MNTKQHITFPTFSGIRCLMMPYVQGYPESVPDTYAAYADIIENVYVKRGDIGFLTIDESIAKGGSPHRGARAKFGRALHTEAGHIPGVCYKWGGSGGSGWGWGNAHNVELERDVKILLANNLDNSCAVWDVEHENTSDDGDIGEFADKYPYGDAILMQAGEVHEIGILTPHESLPVKQDFSRQFLRIVSSGVHGQEPYFTKNPLVKNNE